MRSILMAVLWASSIGVGAAELSLTELYDASLKNDPNYRAADHAFQASQEEKQISQGSLLPQVNLTGRYGKGGPLGGDDSANNLQSEQYRTNALTLQVNQPLFDKRRWSLYDQAKLRGQLGQIRFDAVGQAMFDRVVAAYFDLARVENEQRLTAQQKAAIEGLTTQMKHLYRAGEGTLTDAEEAQARLDFIKAQEIDLQAQHENALRTLSGRAGMPISQIPSVKEQLPNGTLVNNDEDLIYWIATANQSNPVLEQQRAAVEMAEAEIEVQEAAHYPNLALVGQVSRISQNDTNTLNQQNSQDQSSYYVGLTLDVPIYQGGAVNASVRRAVSQRENARAVYDATLQQLTEDLQTDYLGVVSGYDKLQALNTAVRSNQKALTSATRGYQAGARSTVDILDAQQRLYSARRDLLNAKLSMLQSYVSLHSRCGKMNRELLQQVQTWF